MIRVRRQPFLAQAVRGRGRRSVVDGADQDCGGSNRCRAFFLRVLLAISCLSLMTAAHSKHVWAQATPPPTETEALELEFTNPLTTLPQLVLRDSYTPANYDTDVETNQLVIRPLIPRIPPWRMLLLPQLLRPTFALVTIPNPRGGTRTELGDLSLFDLAALPWPDTAKTGILVGFGPSFMFPTATSKSAGQGAWQAGPALGAIYTGIPRLLIGFVAQNPISFAYTSPDRPPRNALAIQPILALTIWDKWYLRSAEATWTIGWHRHSPTLLPLSVGLGRVFSFPGLPPMSLFVTGEWMLYRDYAPVAPQTTINFGVTIALPQLRSYLG